MQLYYDDQSTNSINIFGTYCQLSALQGYNKTLLLKLVKKKKNLHVLQQKPQCFLRLKVFSEILFLAYSGKKRQAYLPINAGSYDGTGYAHLSATKLTFTIKAMDHDWVVSQQLPCDYAYTNRSM